MEGIKRQIRFQIADNKKAFMIFWTVIILANIVFYWINTNTATGTVGLHLSVNGSGVEGVRVSVASGHIISIIIFIIVYSMVMYYESFPAAIGFSATRKDFYVGAVANSLILSFFMAVIQGVLMKIDGPILKALGQNPLYEQLVFNTKSDSVLYIIFILFIIFAFSAAFFNLLGAALYRFTWKLWLVIGGIFMAVLNLDILLNPFTNTFNEIIAFINPQESIGNLMATTAILALIFYLLAFLLIRRISIRSKG